MALLYKVVCKWGTGYLDDSCLIRDEATRQRELRALWAEADRIAENHRDELFDENGRLKKHYQSADENAQYFDLRGWRRRPQREGLSRQSSARHRQRLPPLRDAARGRLQAAGTAHAD